MNDQAGRVLTPQGNLLNKHSHKYSGLANSKVINIYANAEGGVSITKVKADAKPNQVASARSHVSLKRTTGPRRANKIAAAETAGKGYRSDLRKVSDLLRFSTPLLRSCQRMRGRKRLLGGRGRKCGWDIAANLPAANPSHQ